MFSREGLEAIVMGRILVVRRKDEVNFVCFVFFESLPENWMNLFKKREEKGRELFHCDDSGSIDKELVCAPWIWGSGMHWDMCVHL